MRAKAKRWALVVLMIVTVCGWDRPARAAGAPCPVLVFDTWDIGITGNTTGFAHITFNFDGTITGYLIIRPTTNVKAANRPDVTNFGFTFFSGLWSFGRGNTIVGFFSGGSEDVPIDIKSFTATCRKGKMSIKATTTNGRMVATGLPAVQQPLLDGSVWQAEVVKDGVAFTEFFSLSSTITICLDDPPPADPADCVVEGPFGPFLNLYFLTGAGTSYITSGNVLLSAGNNIGLSLGEFAIDKDTGEVEAEPGIGRGVTGNINVLGGTSSMTGEDDSPAKVKMDALFFLP
ncbi:MAG TPA: hypothetical protein VGL11_17355 [Candidatus Binatia bacterium]|jgi:hypothetical protein